VTEELPNSECYWVEPRHLLAGEYPGDLSDAIARRRLEEYLRAGVTFFLDLTEAGELRPYETALAAEAAALGVSATYRRFPIRDVGVPRSAQEMTEILDVIDAALAGGQVVYIHCRGGVGRTGTVGGCWLVRHGRSGNEALKELARRWRGCAKSKRFPHTPETLRQFEWVRQWHEPTPHDSATPARVVPPLERHRGCLLGLAAGDAVGTAIEFRPSGTFTYITDMIGGGPFRLKPGQWTDDTSMALCLASSLVERQGFDAADQMNRYLRWYTEGYLSSTGRCFDIGATCAAALREFKRNGNALAGRTDPKTAGNGSLMRLAPVPMLYAARPAEAIERAAESSRTTHAATAAVDACRYFAGMLVGALNGVTKAELLSWCFAPLPGCWEEQPLCLEVALVAAGSFKIKSPPAIRGTGYVVDCLEAALWAFHHSSNFRDGCLLAANLGEDADTTAAVYGQLAGAYYGEGAIPAEWRSCLALRETIENLAEGLQKLSLRLPPGR